MDGRIGGRGSRDGGYHGHVLDRVRREIEFAGRGSLRRMAQRVDGHRSAYQRRKWDTRLVYGAIGLLNARYDYADESLGASELRVFSQNGEDGVIAELLNRIGTTNRFFIEFGVQSGMECNTRFLAEVRGWSGIYFEPDAVSFPLLHERYKHRNDVVCVARHITPENVDEAFDRAGAPLEFDVLSIDVDGQDYWIWQAIEHFRPRIVVIEYNAAVAPGRSTVEPLGASGFEGHDSYGASVTAMETLASRKDYTLVHAEMAGVNLFFVRSDLVGAVGRRAVIHRSPNFHLTGGRHRRADEESYVSAGDEVEAPEPRSSGTVA